MFLTIYQAVLMSLMFVFSLTSFSVMICSLTKYLKNKSKKDNEIETKNLLAEIDKLTLQLADTQDPTVITKLTDQINAAKTKLSSLEAKKK